MKLTPKEELLSKIIDETVQKQRSINEFLEELDKKYKNVENSEQNNTDILSSFGTYLTASNAASSYNHTLSKSKRNLNLRNINNSNDSFGFSLADSFRNLKYNKWNNDYSESNSYDKKTLSNSFAKIKEIYDEYEKYKNKSNISSLNANLRNSKNSKYEEFSETKNTQLKNDDLMINTNYKSSDFRQNRNEMIGRDENLYRNNLMAFNKLSNLNLTYENSNNENEENNEILITNYHNEAENNNSMIDLVIKYKLPNDEDDENNYISKLHLDNVNSLIKIRTLRDEIKSRIYNELKLKSLDKNYSIEKVSLLIPGVFLDDNKKLAEYNLAENGYSIQAFITYNSIGMSKKLSKSINKKNNLKNSTNVNETKINKETYVNENKLVPIDLVPKLTKDGYKCSPSIMELSRKTASELRNVENFRIFNKYGQVEFKEPVNLLGLNLDNQVTIERNLIDTGDKLNYWSKFTLFNFRVGENGLNKYKVNLEKSGGNFLSYKNNELVWEYKENNAIKN